jgi:hypothetical protein
MQLLVDKLIAAGKTEVMVARVPPAWGGSSTSNRFSDPLNASRNQLIQEYNRVITSELVNVTPGPDFFSFLLSPTINRFSLFSDHLHPNALGFVVMAILWENAVTGSTIQPFILDNIVPAGYQQNLLEVGDAYYIDRTYTLTSIPAFLRDGIWIMTANADKSNSSNSYLSFTVDRNVTIYVAYDSRATSLPNWMGGFTDTGETLGVTDSGSSLHLYRKNYPEGVVTLGGNRAAGASGASSNYLVIIVEN